MNKFPSKINQDYFSNYPFNYYTISDIINSSLTKENTDMPIGTLTPTTVEIYVESVAKVVLGSFIEYTFYVNGQEYKELPLDANVREPDPAKSKPYKDMLTTLELEPEKFLENNLGISVIAEKVKLISNNKYELTFPSGTGILNGGHTQLAILDSKTNPNISKAIVKISVREKSLAPNRIAEIAAAQNSSTAVKEYSLAEKKGLFAELKTKLDPDNEKHIIWYEGKQVAANLGIDPTDLIALLNLFNFIDNQSPYNPTGSSQPNASCNSKKTVFNSWVNDSSNLRKVYPLVNDIIFLCETVQMEFTNKTGIARLQIVSDAKNTRGQKLIFSGKIPQYNIPKAFLYSVLSAFRANIFYDSANNKVGWYEDPIHLFRKHYVELFKEVMNAYKTSYKNDIKKVGSDKMLWTLLYIKLSTQVDTSKVWKSYDI